MTRFLVTGSNGLVGSRVCTQLVKAGHEVVGASIGARRTEGEYRYVSCDLSDDAQVNALFATARPEVVIHPASMTVVDACEKDPPAAFAANVRAPANVAMACRAFSAHLLHVSTDYVFDGDHGPYTEEDVPNPRGVYAVTKHMGEQAVRSLAPSWAIARTAVVYGWPASGRPNFGAWLLTTLLEGKQARLFEDQFVSPSLADNVAEMLVELGERKLQGLWNCAGASVVNRVHFGLALCEEFGLDKSLCVPTRLADMKLASPRPLHTGLVMDKTRAALKAQPLALPEALRQFHAAYDAAQEKTR